MSLSLYMFSIMRRYPPHLRNTLPFSRFYRPTLPLLARLLGRNSHYPLRYQFIYLGRMKGLVCICLVFIINYSLCVVSYKLSPFINF